MVLWRAPFGLPGLPGLKRPPRRWGASSSRAATAISDVTGAGLESDMGILPTGTGLDRARRLRWLVQPRCGCSLRLAGGRWFESHSDDLIDTHILLQNILLQNEKNVNHNLQIRAIHPQLSFAVS